MWLRQQQQQQHGWQEQERLGETEKGNISRGWCQAEQEEGGEKQQREHRGDLSDGGRGAETLLEQLRMSPMNCVSPRIDICQVVAGRRMLSTAVVPGRRLRASGPHSPTGASERGQEAPLSRIPGPLKSG